MAAFPEDIASSRLKHSGGDKNLIPGFGLWGRLEGTEMGGAGEMDQPSIWFHNRRNNEHRQVPAHRAL